MTKKGENTMEDKYIMLSKEEVEMFYENVSENIDESLVVFKTQNFENDILNNILFQIIKLQFLNATEEDSSSSADDSEVVNMTVDITYEFIEDSKKHLENNMEITDEIGKIVKHIVDCAIAEKEKELREEEKQSDE